MTTPETTTVKSSRARTFEGEVVSDKMDKTVTVIVRKRLMHALYKKTFTRRCRYMAHDEGNAAKVGDRVRIRECKPMSRNKRWLVIEVVKRAEREGRPE